MSEYFTQQKYDFPIWQTVKLGTHPTKEALLEAVRSEGHRVVNCGPSIINHSDFVMGKEGELDLVKATCKELGFGSQPNYPTFVKRILELGYQFCPHEAALQLRRSLSYPRDCEGEKAIWVATDPIVDTDKHQMLFILGYFPRWRLEKSMRPERIDEAGDILLWGSYLDAQPVTETVYISATPVERGVRHGKLRPGSEWIFVKPRS